MTIGVGNNVVSTDTSDTITKINQARTKYSLGSLSITTANVGNLVLSTHIDSMKTSLQEVITKSGAPYNLNTVINYEVGKNIQATLLQTLYDTSVNVYNYCPCNCNYCSCNCNYCPCNCNYCSCNCNYCCNTT